MKKLIYATAFTVLAFGCASNEKTVNRSSSPDLQGWKSQCLQLFDKEFNTDEKAKGGMIFEYVRNEIEYIDTRQEEKIFQRVQKYRKKNLGDFLFIYHYVESDVNYSIQSFLFKDNDKCKMLAFEMDLSKEKKSTGCNIYEELDKFNSNYINNGLLIISRFDNMSKLVDTKMYYGVGFDQLTPLLERYP